jgi:hypothetical protein
MGGIVDYVLPLVLVVIRARLAAPVTERANQSSTTIPAGNGGDGSMFGHS